MLYSFNTSPYVWLVIKSGLWWRACGTFFSWKELFSYLQIFSLSWGCFQMSIELVHDLEHKSLDHTGHVFVWKCQNKIPSLFVYSYIHDEGKDSLEQFKCYSVIIRLDGSGKNQKSWFFLLGLKYTLRTCFESKKFLAKSCPEQNNEVLSFSACQI